MSPLIDFVFVLDKKGENFIFIVLVYTLLILCFEQKGGEKFIVLVFTPLLMIDKKGEKDFEFEFYMHIYGFAYIKFNWYLEHVYMFCFCLKISIGIRALMFYAYLENFN